MRNIFNLIAFLVITIVMMSVSGCKKNKLAAEEPLRVSTDASALVTSPGAVFDFNLLVESEMPKGGVMIEYTVKGEVNNLNFPQGSPLTTSNKSSKISIRNLPQQMICICEITVTSINKNTNIARTSFRVVYK